MKRLPRRFARLAWGIWGSLLTLALAAWILPASGGPAPNRIDRQVRIMERIIDDALIESPNWVVSGNGSTRGIYLSDFGAIFEFVAGVNTDGVHSIFISGGPRIQVEKDSGGTVRRRSLRGLFERDGEDGEKQEDPVKLYEKGKVELVQMLLDNAGALSALPGEQPVVIVAMLNDSDLREKKDVSRLTLRVKSDDLKAFADGRISESELRNRIRMEES